MLEGESRPIPRDLVRASLEIFKSALGELSSEEQITHYPIDELNILLDMTHYSDGFKEFVRYLAPNFDVPESILDFTGVDLVDDELGVFETGNEHQTEKDYLEELLENPEDFGFIHLDDPGESNARQAFDYLTLLTQWGEDFKNKYLDYSLVDTIENHTFYLQFIKKPAIARLD